MTAIINQEVFSTKGLNITSETTKEEWLEIHKTAVKCKHLAGKWLKQSRAWGTEQYGEAAVAQAEAQMEFDLGLLRIDEGDDKPDLNPKDKSKVFVTIEGISQSFAMWQRKMQPEIQTWDKPTLQAALTYLDPIAKQCEEMRKRLFELQ